VMARERHAVKQSVQITEQPLGLLVERVPGGRAAISSK